MKKLIFLLLMAVVLTGFLPAWDTANPPGDFFLEAALSENSVNDIVVTTDTVLDTQYFYILQSSFLALPDTIDFTGQPYGINHLIKPIDKGQVVVARQESDFWLRL